MPTSRKISRRQFLQLAGITAAGTLITTCNPLAKPTKQNPVSPTTAPSQAPAVIKPRIVQVQIDGWAVPDTNKLLTTPLYQDFTFFEDTHSDLRSLYFHCPCGP